MFLSESTPFVPLMIIPMLVIFIPVIILVIIIIIKKIAKSIQAKKFASNTQVSDYEQLFGGKQNIVSISVNMSRVNVQVKDVDLVKIDELKELQISTMISGDTIKCANAEFAEHVSKTLK